MALIYAGLWAGATSFIWAIARSTSSVTRCTPLVRPPCTALNPIAETSAAPPTQPDSGSVNWARHWRTASAWSGTRSTFSWRDGPISTTQRLSGDPIRSIAPRANWRSSAMSYKRYLKLVEPRLATSIFMASYPSQRASRLVKRRAAGVSRLIVWLP